jgi:hypothetical protein
MELTRVSKNAIKKKLKNCASGRDPALRGSCKCSHAIGWKLEAQSWKPG